MKAAEECNKSAKLQKTFCWTLFLDILKQVFLLVCQYGILKHMVGKDFLPSTVIMQINNRKPLLQQNF